jgi:hypothetical protein
MEKQATREGVVQEIMMKKPKSTEELAKRLEQESDNDEFWNQQPTEIKARPSRTSVLSLRLPTDEFRALLRAARNAGESVSTYVRTAIAMRLTTQPTSVTVTYMGKESQVEFQGWTPTYTAGNPQAEPMITSRL